MMDEGFWCLTGLRRLNHGDVEVLGLGFRFAAWVALTYLPGKLVQTEAWSAPKVSGSKRETVLNGLE